MNAPQDGGGWEPPPNAGERQRLIAAGLLSPAEERAEQHDGVTLRLDDAGRRAAAWAIKQGFGQHSPEQENRKFLDAR